MEEVPNERIAPLALAPGMRGFNETTNAAWVVALGNKSLRWCPDNGCWYTWTGRRWRRQTTIYPALKFAQQAAKNATDLCDLPDDAVQAAIRWRDRSLGYSTLEHVLRIASGQLLVPFEKFDKPAYFLNTLDGVINLRTGKLMEHRASRYLSQMAPVRYNPDAKCPMWDEFIAEIFAGDQQLIRYMQAVLGLCLTSDTSPQKFWFFLERVLTEVDTVLNVMAHMLGSYSRTMDASSIVRGQHRGPREDIARLAGARMVIGSEVGVGAILDEALVKRLTGGEKITARVLYKNSFEFLPKFKLLMAFNTLPLTRALDAGMWRRAAVCPFNVMIPKNRRDPKLVDKLLVEAPGILNWMITGLHDYLANGLPACQAVDEATSAWQEDNDNVGYWMAYHCYRRDFLWAPLPELWNSARQHNVCSNRGELVAALVGYGVERMQRSFGTALSGIAPVMPMNVMTSYMQFVGKPINGYPKKPNYKTDARQWAKSTMSQLISPNQASQNTLGESDGEDIDELYAAWCILQGHWLPEWHTEQSKQHYAQSVAQLRKPETPAAAPDVDPKKQAAEEASWQEMKNMVAEKREQSAPVAGAA